MDSPCVLVRLGDAEIAVLYWHAPAGEVHHLTAVRHVEIM